MCSFGDGLCATMFANIFTHYFPYKPFTHALHRRRRSFWHLRSVLKLMALYIGCHFDFSEAGCVANEEKYSYKEGISL